MYGSGEMTERAAKFTLFPIMFIRNKPSFFSSNWKHSFYGTFGQFGEILNATSFARENAPVESRSVCQLKVYPDRCQTRCSQQTAVWSKQSWFSWSVRCRPGYAMGPDNKIGGNAQRTEVVHWNGSVLNFREDVEVKWYLCLPQLIIIPALASDINQCTKLVVDFQHLWEVFSLSSFHPHVSQYNNLQNIIVWSDRLKFWSHVQVTRANDSGKKAYWSVFWRRHGKSVEEKHVGVTIRTVCCHFQCTKKLTQQFTVLLPQLCKTSVSVILMQKNFL